MAYSLILDTKFKPFSYAEMLAPVQAATTAHQALEDEYGALSTLAGQWENKANKTTDPKTYRMYKQYSDALQDRADTLLKEGLTMSSRRSLLDMKSRYSKEILPIEEAFKRRDELAKEQRTLYGQDPTKRFQRYASQTSLDDFVSNPSWDYGASYSGALLTKQVADAVESYKNAMTSVSGMRSIGLPFQYQQRIQNGATPEQVMQAIYKEAKDGDPTAVKFLRGVRDQVMASSGVAKWADRPTYNELLSFANQGLYKAIGTTQLKDYTDTFGLQDTLAAREAARREAAQIRAEQRAENREAAQKNLEQRIANGNIPIDVHTLVSPSVTNDNTTKTIHNKLTSLLGINVNNYRAATNNAFETTIHYGSDARNYSNISVSIKTWKDGYLVPMETNLKAMPKDFGSQEAWEKAVKAYYGQIDTLKKSLGITAKQPTITDFVDAYKKLERGEAPNKALAMQALRLPFKDDLGVLNNITTLTETSGGNTTIRKIDSFDNEGNINVGEYAKKETFIDDNGKAKGQVAFFSPPNDNSNGIIMKHNGEYYYVPNSSLGSLPEGNKVNIPELQSAVKEKQRIINDYGEEFYYTSVVGGALDDKINNSGAAYIRTMANAMNWQLNSPTYDVLLKSENSNP